MERCTCHILVGDVVSIKSLIQPNYISICNCEKLEHLDQSIMNQAGRPCRPSLQIYKEKDQLYHYIVPVQHATTNVCAIYATDSFQSIHCNSFGNQCCILQHNSIENIIKNIYLANCNTTTTLLYIKFPSYQQYYYYFLHVTPFKITGRPCKYSWQDSIYNILLTRLLENTCRSFKKTVRPYKQSW